MRFHPTETVPNVIYQVRECFEEVYYVFASTGGSVSICKGRLA